MDKRILITGATGLVGRQLCKSLLEQSYQLVVLGRSPESEFRKGFSLPCEYHQWDKPNETLPPKESLDVNAVIHLAGEPLSGKRWTTSRKKLFRESRINSTKNLVLAINSTPLSSPQVFITASAIGFYGDSKNEALTEKCPAGTDFLANLCDDWERESRKSTCRSAQMRFGIILSNKGGALAEMASIFEKGLGGNLSSGQQWMSWVHIEDVIGAILETLTNPNLNGAINVVSPEPVRNKRFTQVLAKTLKTIAFLPVPKFVLKLALGEMSNMVLTSQKVMPEKLLNSGYKFTFQNIDSSLQEIYSWKESSNDHLFEQEQWVPNTVDAVFDFFSDEKNLESLTPAFLKFKVVAMSTESIQLGTEIDYKLKLHGLPVRWRSKITSWQPKTEFADTQLKGPYSKWHHRHIFTPLATGVLLEDKVVYRLPLSFLGGIFMNTFIRKELKNIFYFRKTGISTWSQTRLKS